MIEKLSAKTNALTWFEIPVTDIERARTFYETILDIRLETLPSDDAEEQTVFFPRLPDTIMALSGTVSGALVKSERVKPGNHGPLIYLNASPSVQEVATRVDDAGGKILQSPIQIPAGHIAIIVDTEGNKIGLHSAGL
jgi:predicted enzyme related to lactoylglutathione lyase